MDRFGQCSDRLTMMSLPNMVIRFEYMVHVMWLGNVTTLSEIDKNSLLPLTMDF